MKQTLICFLLGCFVLFGSGCVSKPLEEEAVKCSTSQNHKGLVTISWDSRPGVRYRLLAYEKGRIFKDDKIYRGTGERITIQFMRNPASPLPEYRVMVVPDDK